jgi:hypothetical protein
MVRQLTDWGNYERNNNNSNLGYRDDVWRCFF